MTLSKYCKLRTRDQRSSFHVSLRKTSRSLVQTCKTFKKASLFKNLTVFNLLARTRSSAATQLMKKQSITFTTSHNKTRMHWWYNSLATDGTDFSFLLYFLYYCNAKKVSKFVFCSRAKPFCTRCPTALSYLQKKKNPGKNFPERFAW